MSGISISVENSVSLSHQFPGSDDVQHIQFSIGENGVDIAAYEADKYDDRRFSFCKTITFDQFRQLVLQLSALIRVAEDKPTMLPSESRQSQ